MKTYFRLLSFAKPLGRYAIPYILFTILSVIFGTLNLALVAPLLNTLFNPEKSQVVKKPSGFFDIFNQFNYYASLANQHFGIYKTLMIVCGVIILSVFLGNFFRYLSQRTMENLRIQTLLNLRKSVFDHVMNLDIGYFNNERKGDIISKVASDVQVVQFSVTGTLQVIFKEPLTLIAYLVVLFVISYKLTLMSMLIIPIAGLVIARIVKRLKRDAADAHISYGTMISYLDEALNGIRVIKAFNAKDFITKRFDDENEKYSRIVKSMARRQQLASPVSESLGVLMVGGIVLYGGWLILGGNEGLNAASFIAYIAIFSQVMRPAKAITDSFSNIHSGLAAGERVLGLIDEKPVIRDKPGARELTSFNESIKFENVSFRYNERIVLNNINLEIPKGKTIALVGPSGGGKSTLMDMIPRFIQPYEGKIRVDGTDIQDYSLRSLRSMMGIVSQDSILFNDSIYNNIAFGQSGISIDQVIQAAKIANAHDFILSTANGYETNIGDRGVKLSGGQRQRICIARAVLNNPPVMLLDEATSALDTESEKIVQEALNNLMKQRTSLIIAHRLSTIQHADEIVVIENGRIAERGTYLELIERQGLFRRLTEMQAFSTAPV
ncbi:ABC transporter ATP-binding protein [Pollutibacter soli]|uniref:ABC transporter ATP-binding protein n=1 Tax=Pollutibacter soli TaxID=3034157 RepID=UPI00301349C6